ncbi:MULTISPECIES: CAP domain-containing protein [unclassified Burkholderia]|uniref:CAP domain-containing protein n=1 Tax=unclassified Burkholderia TaxID=2613784 RepID=UPI00214F9803|nr:MULTISPECIES: CAP domain-containing protein [unclassified Burkholderia]MCR4471758.1 CAP domain-containing protein [Burkholderia sp. SCN-KJ]
MKNNSRIGLTALSLAVILALTACGGGGSDGGASNNNSGSAGGSNSPSDTLPPGTQSTAQYASGSIELAAFNRVNQYRIQCGFPAVQQNTLLDQAAAAHAAYGLQNNVIGDTESSTNPGFTGATYADRATHFGFPQSVYSTGESVGYYTGATLSNDQYGNALIDALVSGVYHVAIATWPITVAGVGVAKTTFNGYPQISASLGIGGFRSTPGTMPLTFPCQGVTGVPYSSFGESPTPPNTSGPWGTPVAVAGNPTDTILMQSGTMTDTSGNVISLKVLDSATDPNKLLPKFEGVAYPTSPLQPNTTYSVSITGTVNGTAFSRNFTFTTGNVIG